MSAPIDLDLDIHGDVTCPKDLHLDLRGDLICSMYRTLRQ